jgi:hypothetical protein
MSALVDQSLAHFEPSTAHSRNPLVTAGFFVKGTRSPQFTHCAWQQNGNAHSSATGCGHGGADRDRRLRNLREPLCEPWAPRWAATPTPRLTECCTAAARSTTSTQGFRRADALLEYGSGAVSGRGGTAPKPGPPTVRGHTVRLTCPTS